MGERREYTKAFKESAVDMVVKSNLRFAGYGADGNRKEAVRQLNRRFAARRLAGLMYTLLKKGEDYEVRHFKPGAGSVRGKF